MQVCLTHCAVKDMFGTSPKREATSHNVILFRGLLQVVNSVVTKSLCFVSVTLRVRFLALMHSPK